MGLKLPYAPQTWVDGVTPDDKAHRDVMEAGIASSVQSPTAMATGEAPVWTGAGWERSSVQKILRSGLDFGSGLTNTDIAAGAGIAKSKLAALAIVDADVAAGAAIAISKLADPGAGKVIGSSGAGAVATTPSMQTIFDVVVGRGGTTNPYLGGSMIDPAGPAATIDSNTILGGNIPATYKHLIYKISGRSDAAGSDVQVVIRFNNDSAANYDFERILGGPGTSISTVSSEANYAVGGQVTATTAPASHKAVISGEIIDYTETTFYKGVLSTSYYRYGAAGGQQLVMTIGSQWRNTAAINRIAWIANGGNWIAGTRLTLYGVN